MARPTTCHSVHFPRQSSHFVEGASPNSIPGASTNVQMPGIFPMLGHLSSVAKLQLAGPLHLGAIPGASTSELLT